MNNSSYFKSTLSWEESKENLNDAILLSSNDEILSKSDDEIFYDTNEYSVSCESILTDISDAEGYESCSEFSENTDSTSWLSLPAPKSKLKNVSKSSQDLNNLQNEQDPKTTREELFKNNEDVPLRVLLKRMFDEILGRYRNKSSTTCSVNKFEKIVKINNSCAISTNSEDFDSAILPSHDSTVSVQNERCSRKLITIWETSNENSDNTLYHQSTLDRSGKCMGKLPNPPFQKPLVRKNDILLVSSDMDDSESGGSNSSIEIQMMSKEIFKKLEELKNNNSLNSTDQNGNSLFTEEMINFGSVNNEEHSLLKLRNNKIPAIFITPPTPD